MRFTGRMREKLLSYTTGVRAVYSREDIDAIHFLGGGGAITTSVPKIEKSREKGKNEMS